MKACYLISPGEIQLRHLPIPEPSEGEIIVKVITALTDGTDKKAFKRGHPMIPMPGPFGHEYSGIVYSVGKSIKSFKEGDAVMGVHSAPCFACKMCQLKLYNLCTNIMQTKVLGAFAEFIKIPAHIVKTNLFHKPQNITFVNAAMLEPLSCVLHGINAIRDRLNGIALIIGATGAIGLMHIKVLKQMGLTVIASARNQDRLKMAQEYGADYICQASQINEFFTNDNKPDIVFECTGDEYVWQQSVNYVRPGGVIVLFGGCRLGTNACFDTYALHYNEIMLKGVFHFCPNDVEDAFEMLSQGLDLSSLITATVSLDDIKTAFDKLANDEGIKYEIKP